jgi:hypothetical protein
MVSDGTENLSPEQLRALTALLEHGDKAKAARAAKVGRTTLYRWLREDANFQAALEGATRQALKEFSVNLVRLAHKAAQALDDALGTDQDMQHRLRAADIVTTKLLAVREAVDMEDRLARLEAQYVQQQ